MAFVARAPRASIVNTLTTPQEVGPGSYTVQAPPSKKYPSYVPFATSTARGFDPEQTSHAYNPGPGEYSLAASASAGALHPSTCFLSNVSRLYERRDTPAFTPGPGSYKAGSTFSRLPAKRSWHMQGQPKAKSALPKGPHLPPSVPSKAQSYGYEETPEGGLIPQAPEAVIFTGEKSNTIGPGQYNPTSAAVKAEPKAANFGRGGEIDRTAFLLSNTVAPGPGAYTPRTPESSHKKHRTPDVNNPNAAGAIAALQAKLRSARRAATGEAHLVDEVLRATLKFGAVQVSSSAVEASDSPIGPGYYTNLPTAFDNTLKKPSSRIYGGQSQRPSMAAGNARDVPGPGSYGSSITQSWLVTCQPRDQAVPAFGSTIARWNSAASAAPGPGTYDHNVLSMQTELDKKSSNTARHGAFGVGERFVKPKQPDSASELRGPGSYNAPSSAPACSRPSPAFQNKQDRFDQPLQTLVPPAHCRALLEAEATVNAMQSSGYKPHLGPGTYNLAEANSIEHDLQQKLKGTRGRQGQIFTSASRLSPGISGQNSPGPGSYSFATAEKPFTRIKAGFAAGLDRFKDPSGGPCPGPGAYKGAVAPSMVKQSFNITYDDSKLRRFL